MSGPDRTDDDAPAREAVTARIEGAICEIVINRPEKLNAINASVARGLSIRMDEAEHDDRVKIVVLSGAGERAFSSGADMNELSSATDPLQRIRTPEPSAPLSRLSKPLIAMIRGFALGGGLELALACDIRVASEDSVFGFPEITHGWIPGTEGMNHFTLQAGMGKAMELVLSGAFVDAREAMRVGFVEEIFPPEELREKTLAIAGTIAQRPLASLRLAKEAIRSSFGSGPVVAQRYAKALSALCWSSPETAGGIDRFFGQRGPRHKAAGTEKL